MENKKSIELISLERTKEEVAEMMKRNQAILERNERTLSRNRRAVREARRENRISDKQIKVMIVLLVITLCCFSFLAGFTLERCQMFLNARGF